MKCYRKNGSDRSASSVGGGFSTMPSMKCYRKNGSDRCKRSSVLDATRALNEVLPKER